jgi:tripartite-type tricarboxylate transporter receptor subunit TctC
MIFSRSLLHGLVLAGVLCAVAGTTPATAADVYPSRDITFIVPYAPGGSTDPISRQFTVALEKTLKASVNVENKPGGSATLGTGAIVRAKPDGYTIGLGTNSSLAYQPLVNKNLAYKTADDYAPITKLVDIPTLIIVRKDSPYRTFADLMAEARKNPGKVRVSVSGIRTAPDLAIQELNKVAKVRISTIPFTGGGGEAVIALLGGRVEALATQAASVMGHVQAGTVRVLAVFKKGRYELFPDATPIVDAGYNVTVPAMYGIVAPKGMPKDVHDKLVAASLQAINSPEFAAFAKENGYIVEASGPAAFRKELNGYGKQFADLIQFLDTQ